MKNSLIARGFVALLLVMASVFAGVTPASATATTVTFDGSTPSFTAGSSTPVMSFRVTPGDSNPFNRIKIAVYDAAGTNLITAGQSNMGYSPSQASCFTALNAPLVGCTRDGDDAGFFEFSNGTTGSQLIQLNSGLFTLSPTAGNYTFRLSIYNGGTENSSATVNFSASQPTTYNVTFSAGGGSGSQSSFTTTGTFTLPASTTFTPPSGKVFGGWVDAAVSNTVLTAGSSYTVSQDTNLMPVWVNSGNNNNQSTPFTVSNVSFDRGSAASFSSLAVGANVPAFTMNFSGFSGGASVDQINYVLGDPYNNVFFTVPGAVTNSGNNYQAWNPGASTCGITGIRIGGVAQNSNSGISCLKSTYTANGVTQYWNSIKFSTPTTASISVDTASGVFVVSQAGNLNFFATLFNNSVSPRLISNNVQAFDASSQGSSSPSAQADAVSFTIPVSPGQRIVGEDVTISATDLALSTDYSVVLRSTPQILAQGRTVSSSFNTSVTIPDNLKPGWHSITFNATRSDGAAITEVVYFKINADGTLLATSETMPAELALTGIVTTGGIPLAIIVLLMGFAAFFIAREINPDFVRVMSLVRGPDGQLDFVKRRIRSEEL
ncbi:hypothetical protein AINA4_04590 [Aurantimicrobium sp. INA4]|uniref:InlB B-repeat-containing protein n=1 Tax=Aurantimicrobium sp. INA4 TaxID=2986279 RepID=UPI0024914F1C|nr:InlB B-repeat-containing protein [Aurantimicrobium sp. INA4]BDU10538.1 hypothetical protein AINA4_04590 [Aurantimicrobium sp. INA4]